MAFEIDHQTLQDLSVIEPFHSADSVVGLFQPVTYRGKETLISLFNSPLNDAGAIAERLEFISHLQYTGFAFPFQKDELDFIEHYLKQTYLLKQPSLPQALSNYARRLYGPEHEYYTINRGVTLLLQVFQTLQTKIEKAKLASNLAIGLRYQLFITETLNSAFFAPIRPLINQKQITFLDVCRCDYVFRQDGKEAIKTLLNLVYQLDVFCAAAQTSHRLNFCYPDIMPDGNTRLMLKGVFHPFIKNAVGNDIMFDESQNVCFVTGANMAGKSTLLKSVCICVLLAQLGFPVPAAYMQASVFNGLITTINLADNISQGYSHFYSEVLRIKQVAQKIKQHVKMVIVFDELFRGTNVKDAFDSSLAIIKAFSTIKNCLFIISTHITEVAHELSSYENISFKYLHTQMVDNAPVYNYKLKDGITDERLGFWIVQNEKIIEIIQSSL